jgi:outer membrane protein, multidrug efflux system
MLALLLVLAQAAPQKGLTLRDLQERARKNDPRAMQAAAQYENVLAKRDEAHWAFFPNFSTTGYIAGPVNERRLIGGDNDSNPTDPTHLTPGSVGEGWFHGTQGVTGHIEVQAILPVWTFGKLTAAKKALGHLVGATDALLQRARDQAAFDVARAYWGYQTSRNAETSAQKIRDRLKDAQQTAQKLIAEKSDQISKADALKLDYLAEEIEATLASTLKNRALTITGLRLLVGVQPGEDLPIAQQELPDVPVPPNADQLLRRALEQRPEARAAAEAVSGRQAQVDLARARLWPDFGLVGGFGFTTTTNADSPPSPFVNNPYHASSGYIAIGMQGTFDIPQKLARLRQAEADLHEAVAMQVGAQQLVRLDVQQALGDLGEARVRVDRYSKETQIGKQLATQAGVAFDTGLGEAREFLESTLLYARADGERLKALYDAQVAWAALEKAAGAQLSP